MLYIIKYMENEYITLIRNMDANACALLGEFNSENKYDIADNLKQDLKKANKLITEYKPDAVNATASVGSHTFNFIVYIQLGEQNKKRATLFLVEKAKIILEDKELLTFISSVIIQEGQNLLSVIKKEFNLFLMDESEGIDMSNSNLTSLINKKDQVIKRSKFLQKELVTLNKAYVLRMLSIIKTSGTFGNQFIFQFKNYVKLQNLDKRDEAYWNKLKNILDKFVIENAELFDAKTKQKMEDLQIGYRHMVLNTKEPVITKPEKKKSGGKDDNKSKSKSKGGGKDGNKGKSGGAAKAKSNEATTGQINNDSGNSSNKNGKNVNTNATTNNTKGEPLVEADNDLLLMNRIFERDDQKRTSKDKSKSDDGRVL